MISFFREGSKVEVRVEHGVFLGNEYFGLEIGQSQPYQAELLRSALNENLKKHINKIKKDAYDAGWKDAKAKNKKRTDFYGFWKFL